MFDKLDATLDKYEDLTQQLSDPQVISDQSRYGKLAKQHRDLETIVDKYREYKAIKEGLAGSRALLSDPDMAELAREDILDLESRIEKAEADLKVLLLPKDPNDEKNVVLEIRA